MSETAATTTTATTQTAAPAAPGESATQKAAQTQAQGSGDSAQATQAAKKTEAPKPVYHELKIDGKVVKMTEDELKSYASMGKAADKRFQEAAEMRKQAEKVISKLRTPKQVIAALQDPALGLSKDQIREEFEEWYAREFIDPEQMSPEQIKLRDAEERLRQYEDKEKQSKAEVEQREMEEMTTKAREEVQSQIIEALESSALPRTEFTIRRLAYWMQKNHANGFNAPTEVLVRQVQNEIDSTLRSLVSSSDGDVLIKLLGNDVITKLRKYDLEQLKKMRGQGQQTATHAASEATPKRDANSVSPTSRDVTQRLRELQRTGQY